MADDKNGVVVDDAADDVRLAIDELKKAQAEPQEPVKEPEEKEPVKEPEAPKETETKDERPRGPDGKFVKKEADAPTDVAPKDAPAPPVETPPSPALAPPRGWSVAAKAQFDAFAKQFPALAQEVLKRETDVSNGFKQYEGLGQFVERAAKSGTTLANVIQRYVHMEDTLRQNPEHGLAAIAQNMGMTQYEAAQLFSRLAQRFGAQPQNGMQATQPTNYIEQPNGAPQGFDPNALAPILTPLQQKLSELERTLHSQVEVSRATHERAVEAAIERFRSNHRYFDNVEDSIAKLFESGMVERTADPAADLAKAYEIACWQNPEIRPLLIKEEQAKAEEDRKKREREVAQKAKAASKSLTGSPAPGTIVHALEDKDDVYADAAKAYRQHAMQ